MNINPNSASMLNFMDRSNIEKTSENLENADDKKSLGKIIKNLIN